MARAPGSGPGMVKNTKSTSVTRREGPWTPSQARDRPPKEKPSMAAMFDRLAKAAAAHDSEAPAGIFGESG